jgi:hypothetical protein
MGVVLQVLNIFRFPSVFSDSKDGTSRHRLKSVPPPKSAGATANFLLRRPVGNGGGFTPSDYA